MIDNSTIHSSIIRGMMNGSGINCSSMMNCTTTNDDEELGSSTKTVIYIAYILNIILGISGNLLSIIVFTLGRRCNTDIRSFLISLAVADLMMATICVPFAFTSALQKKWIWSEPMCPIILFTQMVSVTVSVYTNTAISIDRFIAIKYPMVVFKWSRRRKAIFIAVIWIVSIALCAVQLWASRVENGICTEAWPGIPEFRPYYTIIVLIITYIIPVLFIMIMYGLVCVELWFRITPGSADQSRDARQLNTKKKVVKMLMTMIILFTLCWMPLHIFFLLLDFGNIGDKLKSFELNLIYFAVHWLAMSNSFQNPIIYGFLNDNFRYDLAELLLRCCPPLACISVLARAAKDPHGLQRTCTRTTIMHQDSRLNMHAVHAAVAASNAKEHANSNSRVPLLTANEQDKELSANGVHEMKQLNHVPSATNSSQSELGEERGCLLNE